MRLSDWHSGSLMYILYIILGVGVVYFGSCHFSLHIPLKCKQFTNSFLIIK